MGDLVEQIAWNQVREELGFVMCMCMFRLFMYVQSFTVAGAIRSLNFWDGFQDREGNSGAVNRRVCPSLNLQRQGYDLGLQDELNDIAKKVRVSLLEEKHSIECYPRNRWIPSNPSSPFVHNVCNHCNRLIDFVSIDDNCPCQFQLTFVRSI